MDEHTKNEIRDAVVEAFAMGVDGKRFVDVTRVPLLCQSIINLDKKVESLVTKEEFWPVKTLVYGTTGLMLSAVIGALMILIIKT